MGRSPIGSRLALAVADVVAVILTVVLFGVSSTIHAQTTAGIGMTVVFPVTAQTASFASEVTLFNPGPNALTASVKFYEANNSATPGLKTCSDVTIAAVRSAQIKLSTQCTLTAASHFGLLVVADKASPQSHNFYGYMRVQNPQGIGFSVEGFPLEDFSNQVADVIGLKRQAASPGYQTNCFVGSLDQPVSYSVKLFNGFSGSQIGSTVTGSLTAFQQIRYLDIFGASGVNAPAGDQFNVRAEFTQASGGTANLIGFCTVQDNTSFGADFRVAKSYGSPSANFFAQGGNAFGTTATLGTTDNQPLNIIVNGVHVMHYEQNATSPNIIGGFVNNGIYPGVVGATIAGGGFAGSDPDAGTCPYAFGCQNTVTDDYGTVGGGAGNLAGDTDANLINGEYSTVAGGLSNAAGGASFVGGGEYNQGTGVESSVVGGDQNVASGNLSAIGGGHFNAASAFASAIPGGQGNTASGKGSFAAGDFANANADGCFVWADVSAGFDFEPGSMKSDVTLPIDLSFAPKEAFSFSQAMTAATRRGITPDVLRVREPGKPRNVVRRE